MQHALRSLADQEEHLGVRSALHHALRSRGHNPTLRDPWYFPSMEDYVKVSRHLVELQA